MLFKSVPNRFVSPLPPACILKSVGYIAETDYYSGLLMCDHHQADSI